MLGDHTLFISAENIERLWRRSTPSFANPPPLHSYRPGSWGPEAGLDLIAPLDWRLPFERPWHAGLDAARWTLSGVGSDAGRVRTYATPRSTHVRS